jgi:hypothetical protein
MEQKQQLG